VYIEKNELVLLYRRITVRQTWQNRYKSILGYIFIMDFYHRVLLETFRKFSKILAHLLLSVQNLSREMRHFARWLLWLHFETVTRSGNSEIDQ